MLNDYIANHHKKFEIFPVKAEFILIFDIFSRQIRTDFHYIFFHIDLQQCVLVLINFLNDKGYKLLHVSQMYIKKQFMIKEI